MLVFVIHWVEIHQDVNDNQVSRGKDPSADLGYILVNINAMVFIVLMLNIALNRKKYYPQYTALTSFATEADANKFVDSLPTEKGVAFMTIRRDRYQADASQILWGYYSNLTEEEANLHKVYEKMSDEDAAALFKPVYRGNYRN